MASDAATMVLHQCCVAPQQLVIVVIIFGLCALSASTGKTPFFHSTSNVTFTLKDALQLLGIESFVPWTIPAAPLAVSEHLQEDMRRFEAFDLENSEAAKLLLLDALFAEIVPRFSNLKVWKSAALETDTLTGIADYVIAPRRAYLATPLLCVAEAKKDDFVQGRAQCLVEIVACVAQNRAGGTNTDIYGIVSSGQVWQFYPARNSRHSV